MTALALGLAVALLLVGFIIFAFLVFKIVKKILSMVIVLALNSVVGVAFLVAFIKILGIEIPLNAYTVVAAGLFGLPAVATLTLLHFGGLI